jgi:hypothetical protein
VAAPGRASVAPTYSARPADLGSAYDRAVVRRWPLVGREDELAELLRLLASNGEPGGEPRGAAVFGDAGVGKTRLVSEAVDARRADGVAAELVRATEAASHIPLGSLAHLLAPGDTAHERDDLLHQALARLHERAGDRPFLLPSTTPTCSTRCPWRCCTWRSASRRSGCW